MIADAVGQNIDMIRHIGLHRVDNIGVGIDRFVIEFVPCAVRRRQVDDSGRIRGINRVSGMIHAVVRRRSGVRSSGGVPFDHLGDKINIAENLPCRKLDVGVVL